MADKFIRDGATWNGDGLSSALASGSTVTFTIASPGKVNWTGHGLAANALVYFGVTTGGVLPTGITAGTTYYVRNPGTNDFEVSATSGGASINFSGTPSGTANCTTTGAWNHINIFTANTAPSTITGGTQGAGTVAAGDTVYIRSKTEAGADMTTTFNSASIQVGSGNATASAPVCWVIDGGTKWSNIDGTFTFAQTTNTGNYGVTVTAYNWIKAENVGKFVVSQGAGLDKIGALINCYAGVFIENALFDSSANTAGSSYGGIFILNASNGGFNRFTNCTFKLGDYYGGALQNNGGYGIVEMVGCTIELCHAAASETQGVFYSNAAASQRWRIIGGEIKGIGAVSGHWIANFNSGYMEFIGTKIPGVETVNLFNTANGNFQNDFVAGIGLDTKVGADYFQTWGFYSSRADNNPPYLNAVLPDSVSTPWAWYIYPRSISNGTYAIGPYCNIPIVKLYTDTAAAKKITIECLISTTCAYINKKSVYIDVTYIDDTTGLPRTITTHSMTGTEALDSSSASWSSTAWGTKNFNRYKLEVTTPTAIKKDTGIFITFNYRVGGPSSTDVAFLCPDPQLSAAA